MFPHFHFHDASDVYSTRFLQHWSHTKNLRAIQEFHAHLLRSGLFCISTNLQTELILAYTTCLDGSRLKKLNHFFKCLNPKNPLPFNSILSHFSRVGFDCLALTTLSFMHYSTLNLDSFALCSSIKSASCLKTVCLGRLIHSYVEKSGWMSSVFVGSALIGFYSKLSWMNDAAILFDEIPVKNTVCLNALMSGYAESKMWDKGIQLVRRMPLLNLEVDNFTFSVALRGCIGLYAVELGKQIHGSIIRKVTEFRADVFLQSLLIEMYGKCGLLESARKVFDLAGYEGGDQEETTLRDVILWTSMLGVYGKNGNYVEVITLFKDMVIKGIKPDGVAFLAVISACGHAGQVNLGTNYFKSMTQDYGLISSREHYSCLVDMLCRAGELERAWKMIDEITNTGDENFTVSLWGALLSACYERGNVKLGKLAAQRALDLEPENVGIYVLLSNMYAKNGMWDDIEELRELMKRRGLKKDIAWSLIGAVA